MGLKESLNELSKRFGEGKVMRLGDKPIKTECLSTGSLKIDTALGGGFAVGKIHEIYSESGCGKTSITLETAAECQKNGGTVAFVDMECALNKSYAAKVGCDVENMLITQPDDGEQAFEIIRSLIKSGDVDLIIVDSVSSLTSRSELDGEVGEAKIASTARMMSQGLRMITNVADVNKCTIIFINQLRTNIMQMYGDQRVTSGGKSLRFYCTQRVELGSSNIKDGKDIIGFTQKIKVTKNKIAPPFKTTSRDIIYETGVNHMSDILDLAIEHEVCQRKGAWYYYGDVRLGQGADAALSTMRDNPEMVEEISNKVKKIIYG